MRKFCLMRILTLGLLLLIAASHSAARTVLWTAGPSLHFNWGQGWEGLSYGWEISFWTPTDPVADESMVGLDLGFEWQGTKKSRIYSEAQYTYYGDGAPCYIGSSAGPYMELQEGRPPAYGLQGSLWGALLLGTDFRARLGTDGATFSPGLFAKVGSCLGYCEEME